MASYKVPQDVEADDKLIGPFSFRQFIYLIIVAMSIALAWGLGQLFIGLAIIPLPIILLFGALALPLRKDQPMEIYLAAIVSFYLKPNKRLWDPEGLESTIEITAPKTREVKRTKDLSEGEATERLSYLANIVDTQGWSIRGVQTNQSLSMNNDVLLEAQGAEDILATNTSIGNNFDAMMQESTKRMHEEARQRMMAATVVPEPQVQAPQPLAQQQPAQTYAIQAPQPAAQELSTAQSAVAQAYATQVEEPKLTFNPYPSIQQSVVQPLDQEDRVEVPLVSTVSTSETSPSPDIIELANNADLSIQTIAREANRLNRRAQEESDEVIISLR